LFSSNISHSTKCRRLLSLGVIGFEEKKNKVEEGGV
jgi:hypothetical protein